VLQPTLQRKTAWVIYSLGLFFLPPTKSYASPFNWVGEGVNPEGALMGKKVEKPGLRV